MRHLKKAPFLAVFICAVSTGLLTACQTVPEEPEPPPDAKPIDLSKISGTYECTYFWTGYTTHGQCTEEYAVATDGTATVTGSWKDIHDRSGSNSLRGKINAATGYIRLTGTMRGDLTGKIVRTGYVREQQDGSVTIEAKFTVDQYKASYSAKRVNPE
jgi:hypothetical protein